MKTFLPWIGTLVATACAMATTAADTNERRDERMDLGAFSVSLAVADIGESRTFYEKLGFVVRGGDQKHDWLIMRNGETTIGLFQGMFERNIMTFNPGWSSQAEPLDEFTDVRALQRRLEARGMAFRTRADESSTGPASFVVVDPDGNPILFDQHVP